MSVLIGPGKGDYFLAEKQYFFHPILRSPMSLMEPDNQKKLEGVLEEYNLLNHC